MNLEKKCMGEGEKNRIEIGGCDNSIFFLDCCSKYGINLALQEYKD